MNRLCWWLADRVSGILESGERTAVYGDLVESGETGGQALRDLLGLVFRRVAALLKDWKPWLSFVGLILPLGFLVSVVCKRTADQSATYFWLFANNTDWALLTHAAFWHGFANSLVLVSGLFLTLACWSWTAGFVLGSISRRLFPVHSVLFVIVLALGASLGAPRYLAYLTPSIPPAVSTHAPVFALSFYREIFPLLTQASLVLLPALYGMVEGTRSAALSRPHRILLWIAAAASLLFLVLQVPGLGLFFRVLAAPRAWEGKYLHPLAILIYWPVGYLLFITARRRRHHSPASA